MCHVIQHTKAQFDLYLTDFQENLECLDLNVLNIDLLLSEKNLMVLNTLLPFDNCLNSEANQHPQKTAIVVSHSTGLCLALSPIAYKCPSRAFFLPIR